MSYWFLLAPLVAALFGWVIHSLAVGYFFRQVLPAKHAQLAEDAGVAAAAHFSLSDLQSRLLDEESLKKLMPIIEGHIDHFLRNKLSKSMPVISMFIGEKTINQLKEVFMQELEEIFPSTMNSYFENLQRNMDLRKLVADKINSIPSAHFAELLRRQLSPQIRQFRLLGAISGAIIGLMLAILQWILITI